MKKYLLLLIFALACQATYSQTNFPYDVVLTPVTVSGLPGLHSYAFAQHNGKWLIIGGRKDGIHARQPFNAFPSAQNNTTMYVVDIATQQSWSASLNALPVGIKEQLQATNMNFHQDGNTLYIIGGYAFSATANDHKTFNALTAVEVPGLINAIINGTAITSYFKQITNDVFAITGGQLGKIDDTFYLVGGHRFDGRYNPMNNPTFTQTYSNQIRKFTIDNSGSQLSYANYQEITDAVHLHRRDYNLLPQVFPNGELGYTISSGVFQITADLPFLYPVDIKSGGYYPQTQFNQYLSNYHSGKACLYDAVANNMHNLFFGGISQYYYQNGTLIQDANVPFVKTISRTTRTADGTLTEYQLPVEMPSLKGSGAEFIPTPSLPHYTNEVIKLSDITADEFVIGHLFGGIQSASPSAFTDNQTNLTNADPTVYEVKLVRNPLLSVPSIDGGNPYTFTVSPNPTTTNSVTVTFNLTKETDVDYLVTSLDGKIIEQGEIVGTQIGLNAMDFGLDKAKTDVVILTFIFEKKYFVNSKVIRK